MPPRDAGDIAFKREAPRDRAAGRVARAGHQHRFFPLMRSPLIEMVLRACCKRR